MGPAAILVPATPAQQHLLSASTAWVPPPPKATRREGRIAPVPAEQHFITQSDIQQWRGEHPTEPLRPPPADGAPDKATLKNYRCALRPSLERRVLCATRDRAGRRGWVGSTRSRPRARSSGGAVGAGVRWLGCCVSVALCSTHRERARGRRRCCPAPTRPDSAGLEPALVVEKATLDLTLDSR